MGKATGFMEYVREEEKNVIRFPALMIGRNIHSRFQMKHLPDKVPAAWTAGLLSVIWEWRSTA